MRLRDLGPWLAGPLALLAASVPRGSSLNGVNESASKAVEADTIVASSGHRPLTAQATAAAGAQAPPLLDRYCDDARHLLWKFVNANEPPPLEAGEFQLAVRGTGRKGQVALDEAVEASNGSDCQKNPNDKQLKEALQPFDLKFLIVTLPDPINSHLPHEFDSGLDAIQAAAAEAGYSMDRFYSPWESEREAQAPGAFQPAKKHDPELQPGLILFRGDQSKLLVVFIIGETPTSGVHKLALSSALEQIANLASPRQPAGRQKRGAKAQLDVKVGTLAPYFTGSVFSMKQAFQSYSKWASKQKVPLGKPRLRIISGNASGVDQSEFFDPHLDIVDFSGYPFTATTGYGAEIRDGFLLFLHRRLRAEPGEVAILRESDTAYGQSFSRGSYGGFLAYLNKLSALHKGPGGAPTEEDKVIFEVLDKMEQISEQLQASTGADEAVVFPRVLSILHGNFDPLGLNGDKAFVRLNHEYKTARDYLDLPFPLHISEIRGAQEEGQTPVQPLLNLVQNIQPFFPVLASKTQGKDLMPSFSELDKAEAELVMSNLLSTLSKGQVRYVGIAATDVQDTIYLAREVHSHCPDAIVFSFGGNLLFLNPDVATDLRGMLVVTSYPLFALNQQWSYPFTGDRADHQFSSEAAEGIFNAALALLDKPKEMLDYAPPFVAPSVRDFEPPVWITAVGKQELVPIAIIEQTPGLSSMYLYQPPPPTSSREPAPAPSVNTTRSWAARLIFWVATLLCGWFAIISIRPGAVRGRSSIWRARLWRSSFQRMLAVYSFLVSLLVFYLLISGLFVISRVVCSDRLRLVFKLPWAIRLAGWPTLKGVVRPPWVQFAPPSWLWPAALLTSLLLIAVVLAYLLKTVFALVWWVLGRIAAGSTTQEEAPVSGDPLLGSSGVWRFLFAGVEACCVVGVLAAPLAASLLVVKYLVALASVQPDTSIYDSSGVLFAAWRYVTPGNGESPLLPLFFASLTTILWSASNVRRTAMLEAMAGTAVRQGKLYAPRWHSYLGFDSGSLGDITPRENRIRSLLSRGSLALPGGLPVFLLMAGFFAFTLTNARLGILNSSNWTLAGSVEGVPFDRLFAFLLLVAYLATSFNLLRFIAVLLEFRQLLRRLSWHPLREACGRLGGLGKQSLGAGDQSERSPGQVPELSLSSPMPTFTALEFSVERAQRLIGAGAELLDAAGAQPTGLAAKVDSFGQELSGDLSRATAQLEVALDADALRDRAESRMAILRVQEFLGSMSSNVAYILEPDWRLPAGGPVLEDPEDRWRDAAGLFLASRVLDYCRHLMAQLRNLLGFTMAELLLLLIAASSYPFPSSDTLLRFSWTMLLVTVGISVWAIVQLGRDRTVSLLSGGTPGKIDWNSAFFWHLLLYVLIPIVTVLGIQFPATLDGIIRGIASILPGGASH